MCTGAAKGLNGKELPFLHSHPLLPALHCGHALAPMYLVRIDGVSTEVANAFDLHLAKTNGQRPKLSRLRYGCVQEHSNACDQVQTDQICAWVIYRHVTSC